MNDNEGTRNFETVQKAPESPKGNKNKPDAKKIITISIFALAIAVILLFSAVIVVSIADALKKPKDPHDEMLSSVKFETVSTSDIEENYYLNTVNKTYPISSEAKKNSVNLVNVYDYNAKLKENDPKFSVKYLFLDSGKIKLLPEVVDAFNAMTSALYKETECDDILLAYGYFEPKGSTLECDYVQELGSSVYIKRYKDDSQYELSTNRTASAWLNKNCAQYGFINSNLDPKDSDENIPSTQFRYVGVAHATYIVKKQLDFNSYIAEITKHSKDNMLEIKGADGKIYAVYYAEDGSSISVPSNYEYEVSSDNKGGYIVTVHLSESKE